VLVPRLVTPYRLAVLVDAPAAIEEAVALLLRVKDEELQHSACMAFIHRLYSAFLITSPARINGDVHGYQWLFEPGISSGASLLTNARAFNTQELPFTHIDSLSGTLRPSILRVF
jgi:hypothetical protein